MKTGTMVLLQLGEQVSEALQTLETGDLWRLFHGTNRRAACFATY